MRSTRPCYTICWMMYICEQMAILVRDYGMLWLTDEGGGILYSCPYVKRVLEDRMEIDSIKLAHML